MLLLIIIKKSFAIGSVDHLKWQAQKWATIKVHPLVVRDRLRLDFLRVLFPWRNTSHVEE